MARATFRWSLCPPSRSQEAIKFYCLVAHTYGVQGKPQHPPQPCQKTSLSAYREYALMGIFLRLPFSAETDEARKLGSNVPGSNVPHSKTPFEQL